MPWRRSAMSQKPVPHSISNRLEGIKAERCGPKLIILGKSFYAYRRRKRTSSSPSGRVPSLLKKFLPEERTDCGMHPIIASSQTHGTQPDSEGSMPSAGLYVRLLTSVNFLYIRYLSFPSFSLLFYYPQGLNRLTCVLTTRS